MNHTNNDQQSGVLDNTTLLIIVWVLFAVAFVLAPFCIGSYRRRICLARIRERRWNVNVPPERDAEWYRRALERYEEARASAENRNGRGADPSPYSSQQEEEMRQIFLLERIANYTKTLKVGDVRVKSLDEIVEESSSQEPVDSDATDTTQAETDIEARTTKSVSCDGSTAASEDHESTDDEARVEEFHSSTVFVTVPAAGYTVEQISAMREISNGCAICLCEFEKGERLTWASNQECPHVFHETCLLDWLLAVGRKRRKRLRNHPEESTGDPEKDVIDFPMLCPCCRQQFVCEDTGEATRENDVRKAVTAPTESQEESMDGDGLEEYVDSNV